MEARKDPNDKNRKSFSEAVGLVHRIQDLDDKELEPVVVTRPGNCVAIRLQKPEAATFFSGQQGRRFFGLMQRSPSVAD